MRIIIVAYLTGGLVYTECAEQCLAQGKCSAVIMIQVFASMRKTFGKSFRPQHWSRNPQIYAKSVNKTFRVTCPYVCGQREGRGPVCTLYFWLSV